MNIGKLAELIKNKAFSVIKVLARFLRAELNEKLISNAQKSRFN